VADVCWSCGAGGLISFFEAPSIPTSSCVLLPTRQAALEWPVGDLRLVFCPKCGFIQNDLFDPNLVDYTQPYEESQAFSSTFSRFATELAEHLIDTYDLHGKDILEVGCGKGDFLRMLCELGDNRGLGIDPAFAEGRLDTAADVTVRKEFFSESTTHLSGDLIACIHTLEHIQPVGHFVRLLRESAGGRTGSVLFVEVPDTMRILVEGAFWDVYYEHCSYFTLGSLGRLLQREKFGLRSLETGYNDQYLLAEASAKTTGGMPPVADIEAIQRNVHAFTDAASRSRARWQKKLEAAAVAGRRVVAWGASSKGVGFLTALEAGRTVGSVVDINPYKQGRFMPGTGQEIVAPESLPSEPPDLVIVMNPIYLDEITLDLASRNLFPEIVAV
jgi:SAM-dependent methyltransferase